MSLSGWNVLACKEPGLLLPHKNGHSPCQLGKSSCLV